MNIEKLKKITDIQCSNGNWDFDPYMHGMANGMILAVATIENQEPKYLDAPNWWKPISEAKLDGKEVWLGWKPFENGAGGVVPRRGTWDVGSKQWICHWEDHGDPGGHRPMPFDPQPDYYCEGFDPAAPTE